VVGGLTDIKVVIADEVNITFEGGPLSYYIHSKAVVSPQLKINDGIISLFHGIQFPITYSRFFTPR
jgi:hypothetical protein